MNKLLLRKEEEHAANDVAPLTGRRLSLGGRSSQPGKRQRIGTRRQLAEAGSCM
ncbi:hypothetical protein [Brevibacillus agri]|uniref:hypothetical protein n=1 Tax=Brevibacillus agri TaxID=51101 RepID=UPI0018CD738D|nr:hypothetical protein [Brevibacillus agri]